MNALILYFSGTGNTAYAVSEFRRALLRRNISVQAHSIEENFDLSSVSYDLLLVGFPKYYEYPPLFMCSYLENRLPAAEKTISVLAFCTQAGPLKTDFTRIEKILRGKNHRLTVSASFPLANNMMIFSAFKATPPEDAEANRKKLSDRTETLLDIFLSGGELNETIAARKRIAYFLVAAGCTKWMPVFAMKFSSSEECVGCGLCAARCPAKNIEMKDGRPKIGNSCLFCMRCIDSCPANAILYGGKKCPQYRPPGGQRPG